MTGERLKAKAAMYERNLNFDDLCRITGLAKGSIHNLLSNLSTSRRGRQVLTNALGVQIWPDVFTTEIDWTLEAGTTLVFPTLEMAKEFTSEVGETTKRRGRYVRLSRDAKLVFTSEEGNGPSLTKKPLNPASGSRGEEAIEIWSGDEPADFRFVDSNSGAVSSKQRRRSVAAAQRTKR